MKEKHTDSVQNRFTAYLVAAEEILGTEIPAAGHGPCTGGSAGAQLYGL